MSASVRDDVSIHDQEVLASRPTDPSRLSSFVRRLPKVELHAHLGGCYRESTLRELAHTNGVLLCPRLHPPPPPHDDDDDDDLSLPPPLAPLRNDRPRSLADCFLLFDEVSRCVADLGAVRRATREALEDFADAHCAYLELRSSPKRFPPIVIAGAAAGGSGKREYVGAVVDEMRTFERDERRRYRRERRVTGGGGCDDERRRRILPRLPMMPRYVLSIDRGRSVGEAVESVGIAVEVFRREGEEMERWKREREAKGRRGDGNQKEEGAEDEDEESFVRYLVGVDLGGNPTKNDFRDFQPALQTARDAGLSVTVHMGEVPCRYDPPNSPSDEDAENSELQRILTEEAEATMRFRPDRVGHALLLPASVLQTLARRRTPVECCPTSNVMTLELGGPAVGDTERGGGLIQALRRHPRLGSWLNTGHPVSISTDDPGVFHTDSNRELQLLAEAWDLDHKALGRIVVSSVGHAFEKCPDALERLSRSVGERVDALLEEF